MGKRLQLQVTNLHVIPFRFLFVSSPRDPFVPFKKTSLFFAVPLRQL